jgi:hypothetical protein
MKYSVEQYIISLYNICCGGNAIESSFHRKPPGSTVLCEAMICSIVTKLQSTGLVLDKKKFRKWHYWCRIRSKAEDVSVFWLFIVNLEKSAVHVGTELLCCGLNRTKSCT